MKYLRRAPGCFPGTFFVREMSSAYKRWYCEHGRKRVLCLECVGTGCCRHHCPKERCGEKVCVELLAALRVRLSEARGRQLARRAFVPRRASALSPAPPRASATSLTPPLASAASLTAPRASAELVFEDEEERECVLCHERRAGWRFLDPLGAPRDACDDCAVIACFI